MSVLRISKKVYRRMPSYFYQTNLTYQTVYNESFKEIEKLINGAQVLTGFQDIYNKEVSEINESYKKREIYRRYVNDANAVLASFHYLDNLVLMIFDEKLSTQLTSITKKISLLYASIQNEYEFPDGQKDLYHELESIKQEVKKRSVIFHQAFITNQQAKENQARDYLARHLRALVIELKKISNIIDYYKQVKSDITVRLSTNVKLSEIDGLDVSLINKSRYLKKEAKINYLRQTRSLKRVIKYLRRINLLNKEDYASALGTLDFHEHAFLKRKYKPGFEEEPNRLMNMLIVKLIYLEQKYIVVW